MSNFVACSNCGKRVSQVIPDVDIVVRAYVECPECIEKQPDKEPGMVDGAEYDALKVEYDRVCKESESWRKAHDSFYDAYQKNRKALEDHVRTVGQFLAEMYAIMIDPLADGEIKVEELCPQLLEAAVRDRQAIYDLQNAIIKQRDQILQLIDKIIEVVGFVRNMVKDKESLVYLDSVIDEMTASKKVLENATSNQNQEGPATA